MTLHGKKTEENDQTTGLSIHIYPETTVEFKYTALFFAQKDFYATTSIFIFSISLKPNYFM